MEVGAGFHVDDIIVREEAAAPAPLDRADASGVITLGQAFIRCFAEVWQDCKAYKTLLSNVKILERELGTATPITEITYDTVLVMVQRMRSAGYAPATIQRKLTTLSTALKWCTVWQDGTGRPYLLAKPIFPLVKVDNMRDRFMTSEEEIKAFDFIRQQKVVSGSRDWWVLECLIAFLIDVGCRLGEALGTRPEDINDGVVSFARYTTKSGRPRDVLLSKRVRSVIPSLIQTSTDGTLFGFDNNKVWRMWRKVRDNVPEIDDVNLHILRHTCATRLLKGKMPLNEVADWLGHADLDVTRARYGHLHVGDLKKGLEILEAAAGPQHLRSVGS